MSTTSDPKTRQTNPNWENNQIQFPRLLSEIFGLLTNEQMEALCESMDLTLDDIDELFDRVEHEWTEIKKKVLNP